MKFIISENRIYDLVMKHLNSIFDVENIHWTYGTDDYFDEVDYAALFYLGDFSDDETLFRWYAEDYWIEDESTLPPTGYEYDRRILRQQIEESPILEFENSNYYIQLDGIFGNKWKEPFKDWFMKNFGFPIKTIK